MTESTTRDPRVVAAALAIAATESRPGKVPSDVASAADYHEAIAVVRAIDDLPPAGPSPEAKALKAVEALLDQWQNGALVNRGPYEGVTWIEPVWPLPAGAVEIRKALDDTKAAAGA